MPYHTPIMVKEVMDGLQVAPGKRFIDATVGGGGHAEKIIQRGGALLGIDTDEEAVEEAKKNTRGKIVWGNFRNIAEIAKKEGFDRVDGILFDLGVSSHQLDTEGRGFSYRFGNAPLDLRLNQTNGMTAAEYLQKASEKELYEAIGTFGEEERARTIAHAIVRARSMTHIRSTGDLLHVIEGVARGRESKPVASRVFQALRIAINDELSALKEGLSGAKTLLKPGGRLAVISFHSLEDRVVKQFFRSDAWKVITKKPIVADEREIRLNKRARSAKLRIALKL